jgi:hypothetical protein
VKQAGESSACPDDVVLEVDRDQCGACGLDVLLLDHVQTSSQVR